MDPSRPSTSSSHDQSIQNPFASNASYSDPSSPHHTPLNVPESPSNGGFPFATNTSQSQASLFQRRSQGPIFQPMSRPETTQSQHSAEGLMFTPRHRTPEASFMGPPRIGSMASRDSAFAAPPIRHATPSVAESGYRKPVKAIPFKSTALVRDADGNANLHKPWLEKKDPYVRISYFVTWTILLLFGLGGSGLAIFFSWKNFPRMPPLCLVMEDNFESFDTTKWNREVDLGGFGNHQFDMTTNSEGNSYVKDGKLFITPTLTGDVIGYDNLMNGFTYNLTDCTNLIIDETTGGAIPNPDACGAVSNSTAGVMIPPVMSARVNTKGHASIQYGKVTVRAKLPRGDWLWPAIWMLPEEDFYGKWPMSGEIDIMEARGNDKTYPAQGRNYVRSSLNWGPTTFINAVSKTYGWWYERRITFDQDFHDYTLEWTPDIMWMYIDTRLHRSIDLRFNKPFFERGEFPEVVTDPKTEQQVVLENPWKDRGNSAPFDRPFYLILNVAVGGTNGWFPDGAGNKPWLDGSKTAMVDFWNKRDDWIPTWGTNPEDHSMVVESVKMWQSC